MLIEQRTYTLEPRALPRFLAAYESLGFAAHRDIYERLVGYFVSETGTLNQIVHLWAYQDLNERAELRTQLAADPDWQKYVAKMLPLLQSQESKFLNPAPFFTPMWNESKAA